MATRTAFTGPRPRSAGPRDSNRAKLVAIGLATCVALTMGTVAAVAAIPGSTGLITGCRDTRSGALRVIDADTGQVCKSGEAKLTWNQTGAPGPQGPKGDAGVQGPVGPSGLTGARRVEASTTLENLKVRCGPGEVVVSGGFFLGDYLSQEVIHSYPWDDSGDGRLDAWVLDVINNNNKGWIGFAMCASAT